MMRLSSGVARGLKESEGLKSESLKSDEVEQWCKV